MSASSKSGAPLAYALLLLTFTTGVVDAVSFVGLGRVFTALMTGNVVFVGFALGGVDGLNPLRSLAALAAFLVGAAIGGRLGRRMLGQSHRSWLIWVGSIEVIALLVAGTCGLSYDLDSQGPAWSLFGIIVFTALAMGLRNVTAVRLAVPDLRTTVLTLTLAGIAADSPIAGGSNPRFGWRLGSVGMLFLGAAAGGFLLVRFGMAVPLFTVAALVPVALGLYLTHPASQQLTRDPKATKSATPAAVEGAAR